MTMHISAALFRHGQLYVASMNIPKQFLPACSSLTNMRKVGCVTGPLLKDIVTRLEQLSHGNPFAFQCDAIISCTSPLVLEKVWHGVFDNQNIHNGWFHLSENDVGRIKTVSQQYFEHQIWDGDEGAAIQFKKLQEQLSEMSTDLDGTKNTVSNPKRNEEPVSTAGLSLRQRAQLILNVHKKLLRSLPARRSYLDSKESEFMMHVLENHPQARRKIGKGVDSIFVQETSYPGSFCFHVKRFDGSEEDFSYRWCVGLINETTHYTWIRQPNVENG